MFLLTECMAHRHLLRPLLLLRRRHRPTLRRASSAWPCAQACLPRCMLGLGRQQQRRESSGSSRGRGSRMTVAVAEELQVGLLPSSCLLCSSNSRSCSRSCSCSQLRYGGRAATCCGGCTAAAAQTTPAESRGWRPLRICCTALVRRCLLPLHALSFFINLFARSQPSPGALSVNTETATLRPAGLDKGGVPRPPAANAVQRGVSRGAAHGGQVGQDGAQHRGKLEAMACAAGGSSS